MSGENNQPAPPQDTQPQPQPSPYTPQPQPQPMPYAPHQAPVSVKGTRGRGLGIAAMVLGIVGVVCAFIPAMNLVAFPVVVVGLVLGIVSVVMARGGRGPKGFGIAGIACSAAALIITIIMYIILTAAAGVAAYYYVDNNMSALTYDDAVASDSDISVRSVAADESGSSSHFYHVAVRLENNTSDTISYVQVELPLYDESGIEVSTAYGSAALVGPGVFEIDAVAAVSEGAPFSFDETELIITIL